MKKTLSLFAMLTVLIGAVTMVTSCGAKIQADSVWQVKKMGITSIPADQKWYVGLAADGKAYFAAEFTADKNLRKLPLYGDGEYTAKNGKIKMPLTGNVELPFKIKGETLTIYAADKKTEVYVLEKVSKPTIDDVKNAKSAL